MKGQPIMPYAPYLTLLALVILTAGGTIALASMASSAWPLALPIVGLAALGLRAALRS